jgi:hypothetical protein
MNPREELEPVQSPMTRRAFARKSLLAVGGVMAANVAGVPGEAKTLQTPKSKLQENKAIVGR